MVGLTAVAPETVSCTFMRQVKRRSVGFRALVSTVLGVAAFVLCWSSAPGAPAFTPSRQPPVVGNLRIDRALDVACFAEGEATTAVVETPPTDEEAEGQSASNMIRKSWRPKRERRGTLCFARRELNEEAWRLRQYIEPLLEQQMSIKEITFALNRQGSQLRHLLYRPRLGIPVFTEHKVRRILRRNKTEKGRLNNFARPKWLPPKAPGAPYPEKLGDVFAEVPPLAPWEPQHVETVAVKPKCVVEMREIIWVEDAKGFHVGDKISIGGDQEQHTIKAITWNGEYWEITVDGEPEKEIPVGSTITLLRD